MSSTMSPGMHPVVCALRVIDAGLDQLGEANLWSLLDSESLQVRAELERLSSRLTAARLGSTRDVESGARRSGRGGQHPRVVGELFVTGAIYGPMRQRTARKGWLSARVLSSESRTLPDGVVHHLHTRVVEVSVTDRPLCPNTAVVYGVRAP